MDAAGLVWKNIVPRFVAFSIPATCPLLARDLSAVRVNFAASAMLLVNEEMYWSSAFGSTAYTMLGLVAP